MDIVDEQVDRRPSVATSPAIRPVGELLRGRAPLCPATATVRDAAVLMTTTRRRCVLVPLADGSHGIVTEGDLTRRVVAAGLGPNTPVTAAMTSPVHTCPADRLGADALRDMLECGVRTMPVLSTRGEVLGIVEDADLLAGAARGGFLLRGAVARTADTDQLIATARQIPALVLDLHRARVAPTDVSAILSVIVDATVARALDLVAARAAPDLTWLSLGSVARREALPNSDLDTAVVVGADIETDTVTALAARVHDLLDSCGLRADAKGATADRTRFSRSHQRWLGAVEGWIADPFTDRGLVMLSMLADSRETWGDGRPHLAEWVATRLRTAPAATRLLLRQAVDEPARLHPLRRLLTRRTGNIDLKADAAMPVVNIARWAGICAGVSDRSTTGRLRAAAGTGLLLDDDARVLSESFEVVQQIRLRHQCEILEQGHAVTDEIAAGSLTPLFRSLLSEAVREIAGVQRRLSYAGPPAD
ncbi:putative nucleotidyltransferase substrate binding domain-containing protein [Rhodococcus sp. W8901]|uniref:putative nucleotidyltransferase substrate binding domain-containing protein n=1 Tax=Rhodococcus sp. W8901 TaxID=2742603 RepID=UPI0020C5C71E|nr:putative nucleotidyltransferase substrate binding domain-containing protein [Rhodococcus sp. W8901]